MLIVDLLPKGELSDLSLPIGNAGFGARTMVIFRWDQSTRKVLKEEVLKEAVDIEGVAKEMLEADTRGSNASSSSSKNKGKGKAVENGESGSGSGGGKKLPKWLNKLAKK